MNEKEKQEINQRLQQYLKTNTISSEKAIVTKFDPIKLLSTLQDNLKQSIQNLCICSRKNICNCKNKNTCICDSDDLYTVASCKCEIHSNCRSSIELTTKQKISSKLFPEVIRIFTLTPSTDNKQDIETVIIDIYTNKIKTKKLKLDDANTDTNCNFGTILIYNNNTINSIICFNLLDYPHIHDYSILITFDYMSFINK